VHKLGKGRFMMAYTCDNLYFPVWLMVEGMEESDLELRFFDVLGRERLKLDAQNGVFDHESLTNLPNGAYFIHLNQRGQGTAIIKAAKY
jgi:hypothetical protein